ncbi:MAG: hypothetical protein MR567_04450 [Oscillospiraceae bacterium]|nr:hypothetical protein [Oscillospiraceae bacterium]
MGLFDDLFDFNGDGKTTWDEEYLAFKMFEECIKEQEEDLNDDFDSDLSDDAGGSERYEWRLYCEDGTEFGVDPEDYATEEEYAQALNEAKYGWREKYESVSDTAVDPEDYETEEEYRDAMEEEQTAWRDTCEDGAAYGVDPDDFESEEEYEEALDEARERAENGDIPLVFSVECPALDKLDEIKKEDFPNKRRYNAAYTLANQFLIYCDSDDEKKDKACCRFIGDYADTILAANYLSHDSGFLYAQAIKDNFTLPCSLPDEDETREMGFSAVLCKIAKRDISLSLKIWSWCFEQFWPYAEYDDSCGNDLSAQVILELYNFPDAYITRLVHYMSDNDSFCNAFITADNEPENSFPELIAQAIREELYKTAKVLFKSGLEKADGEWKTINELTDGVIYWCKNGEEVESVEYFRDELLPLVKAVPLGMVQDEIAQWEKGIDAYIDRVEDESERYAYTRKYAWRKTVPDGKKYDLDPIDYFTREEYLAALKEAKYGWRRWYKDSENYGLNPDSFETQEEYREALDTKRKEARQQEQDERQKEQLLAEEKKRKEYENDTTIYTYCGVLLPFSSHLYSFRTDDRTIQIGDTVIIPVGEEEKETEGRVVSVGQYTRLAVPYPVEKTKKIIRKAQKGAKS